MDEERDLETIDTGAVLEQGDALLQSSRDLLAELDRRLGETQPVNEAVEKMRTDRPATGDT